jgi:signal transduction histidine kinase
VETRVQGDSVTVQVSDDGIGIAPEHMSQLFTPFFTTKAVGAGTGLGLSVSHGIVENHGGSIQVESQPEQGTSITVTLPMHLPQLPNLSDACA